MALGREGSEKGKFSAKGILSRREGKPMCARPDTQVTAGEPSVVKEIWLLSKSDPLAYKLSDLREVAVPLWAPVSSSVVGIKIPTLQGCCEG